MFAVKRYLNDLDLHESLINQTVLFLANYGKFDLSKNRADSSCSNVSFRLVVNDKIQFAII